METALAYQVDTRERVQLHATMNRWTSDAHRTNAAYVPALGAAVLELLDPRPGERILDVGCGEGALTGKIVAAGASVVGIDASDEMIAGARSFHREVEDLLREEVCDSQGNWTAHYVRLRFLGVTGD